MILSLISQMIFPLYIDRLYFWREIDSVKLSTALQELVKLNLDKYQEKDWNRFVQLVLERWGTGPYFNQHERNLTHVLLTIVSRYISLILEIFVQNPSRNGFLGILLAAFIIKV